MAGNVTLGQGRLAGAVDAGPRWTLGPVLTAAVITAGVYLALPYLELLSRQPRRTLLVTPVDTTRVEPAAPPLPARAAPGPTPGVAAPRVPAPRFTAPKQPIPVSLAMDLDAALSDVGGDFDLTFEVGAPASLADAAGEAVFEVADIDEPPALLAPLLPVYPPQARMRRVEGVVVLEFIVGLDGRTGDIRAVASHPGEVFVNAAVRAVERWRFRPGTRGGAPVATRVRQQVTFKLE